MGNPVLRDEGANLSLMLTSKSTVIVPDLAFEDGDEFKFNNCTLKVIHTPGHTQGGACYYDAQNGVLFSGDTLFLCFCGKN